MSIKSVTAKTVFDELDQGQPIVILDLRAPSEFEDWRIAGPHPAKFYNIFYADFFENEEAAAAPLPKDQEITIVCAKGGASATVAEILDQLGYQVRHMEGGMLAWSQLHIVRPVPVASEEFKIWQVNRVGKGCLSYVVAAHGEGLIVDPSRMTHVYQDLAQQEGFRIRYVVDTHIHADHISGGRELAHAAGATYRLTETHAGAPLRYEPLNDKEVLSLGDVRVETLTIHTPGHTPESTSFLINDQYLISGDTVFVEGVGRPDLGGNTAKWAQDLFESIHVRLAGLRNDTWVLPAHYQSMDEIKEHRLVFTTFGHLRKTDKIKRNLSAQQFIRDIVNDNSPPPPNYEKIVDANMGRIDLDVDTANFLEIGPNRCALVH
ncbi:MAG: MBL fold metallo-hydrolase [Firmicutes bacterium]|jgi:glyoxylase-like metal-dependent hydrolase (beta-lactamase superfamily II)/rhodanese-related sulfurtransferase|nr:MBL fold metallo-hydrolase [Bacillota bacterium]MCL5015317.1 MBL fold metallo-hydrolase [Bacillota bacterium]